MFTSSHIPESTVARTREMPSEVAVEESKVPLLGDHFTPKPVEDDQDQRLTKRVWIESKKLWQIVGPAIFSRLTSYSMLVITQAFAGHLGDLELAAISIANNVIVGLDFGLLVLSLSLSPSLDFFSFFFPV